MKRFLMPLLLCVLLFAAFSSALAADGTADGAALRTLQNGSSGKDVTSLQNRLKELGLFGGKVDGIYGDQTAAAVAEAKRLLTAAGRSVAEGSKADKATLALIYDEAARDALTTLRLQSKSARVRELQARLIDLKLLAGAADGAYGSATQAAVLAFQQQLLALGATGIQADGVADPATQALLKGDLSSYGFAAPPFFDTRKPLSLTGDYLYSKSCILIDAPTGKVLFALNEHERRFPASTTKMMTLLLAVEQSRLEESVTIPQSASDIPKDSSLVPVYPGEQMRMLDLLYGLIIHSGNDAANAVAELCAGSVDAFVARMNERAAQLGMVDTHFMNPHGYHDDNHYSTAYDLALLARMGLTNPVFCQVVTCLRYTMPPTAKRGELILQTTHELLNPASPYYIPGAAGIKSGFTSLAGSCYVGAAQRGDRTLIAVVLGSPSTDRTWQDLSKLFEYGFATQ
ncbi:MAG: peptidoglycan-binding protein [Clostridia bacterium]